MAGLVPAIHVHQDVIMQGGWVYILASAPNGVLYVGVTNDLVRRVYEHREGLVPGFTKKYGVKQLVYFERYEDVQTAIQREHNIKHWPRTWKVRLILKENPEWKDLYDTIAQ
jgi:putative endonuclease